MIVRQEFTRATKQDAANLRRQAKNFAHIAAEYRAQGRPELADEYESQAKLCNEEAAELERETGAEHGERDG